MPGCSKCKPGITGKGETMDKQYTNDGKNTLKRILDLSFRISVYAPPMKPFLRFSKHYERKDPSG
jgi:hypothetical protein